MSNEDHDKAQIEADAKLEQLVEKSHNVLFSTTAIFPLQLIPDRISIDQTKVTLEIRNILHTENIQTLPLKEIAEVEIVYVLFFGTVIIKTPSNKKYMIPFLRIPDAVRIKQIVTGLLIAHKEQIKLEELSSEGLAGKLVEIGKLHM